MSRYSAEPYVLRENAASKAELAFAIKVAAKEKGSSTDAN